MFPTDFLRHKSVGNLTFIASSPPYAPARYRYQFESLAAVIWRALTVHVVLIALILSSTVALRALKLVLTVVVLSSTVTLKRSIDSFIDELA